MAANGHHHGPRSILVLYRVANSDSDSSDPLFNCFQMPYGSGPTLNLVKQHCAAAHSLSNLGPEGYHWRVMVEDKVANGERGFSWWDVQDGNAKLPVKETTQYDLRKLLYPAKAPVTTADSATKAAKGAFKMMGKVANAVVGEDMGENLGPPVPILAFKLVDLVKIHDDFERKHAGHPPPVPAAQPRPRAPAPAPRTAPHQQQQSAQPRAQPAQAPSRAHQQQPPSRAQTARQPARQPAPPKQEASLMDFGDAPARSNHKVLNHTTSSPASFGNQTRAERLKTEYEKKKNSTNRVWDDVDQRWVEVKPGEAPPGHKQSGNAETEKPKSKIVGVKLDAASASRSASSAKAFQEMKTAQAKAVTEVREREAQKKQDEEAEDVARRALEPKIKAWSEEHGKKKQLRALLASLHTILWPGAKWKQISIGDILDDGKVKRFFHKATLVVHPDKTHHLPPDQRFLAKRVFDALCQAKTDFDNGKK